MGCPAAYILTRAESLGLVGFYRGLELPGARSGILSSSSALESMLGCNQHGGMPKVPVERRSTMSTASTTRPVPAAVFSVLVSVLSLWDSLLLVSKRARHAKLHRDTLRSLRAAARCVVCGAACALAGSVDIERPRPAPNN